MRTVWFVDTSVVCNLLPVPGRDQDREDVINEMRERQTTGSVFILPLTAVVETGNHISQLHDGRLRRQTAEKFRDLLRLVVAEKAPWKLHVFSWGKEMLEQLIDGASTGQSLVDNFVTGLGCGDLCILAEREIYKVRSGLIDVKIWAIDAQLASRS